MWTSSSFLANKFPINTWPFKFHHLKWWFWDGAPMGHNNNSIFSQFKLWNRGSPAHRHPRILSPNHLAKFRWPCFYRSVGGHFDGKVKIHNKIFLVIKIDWNGHKKCPKCISNCSTIKILLIQNNCIFDTFRAYMSIVKCPFSRSWVHGLKRGTVLISVVQIYSCFVM